MIQNSAVVLGTGLQIGQTRLVTTEEDETGQSAQRGVGRRASPVDSTGFPSEMIEAWTWTAR